MDLREALYNVKEKDKDKAEAVNPLVQDGLKLIPSVTRVFSKSRQLYVYLQAYEQDVPAAQPLVAFVSLYSGRTRVFQSEPLKVLVGAANRLKTMPLQFSIPLKDLPTGSFDCQVTVLNPEARKSTFWRAPVVVIQ